MDVVDTIFHDCDCVLVCSFFTGHLTDVKEDQRETGNDELPLAITFREW